MLILSVFFLKRRDGMVRPCAEFVGDAGGHDTEGNLMGGKQGLNQGTHRLSS